MASEDAAVGVKFVDNDVLKVFEEARPLGVMRQDTAVHHVGIREHDIGALADGLAGILRRIAVVGECADIAFHTGDEAL